MKKLMFATALVASAAAFADPTALNANGFEGYTADSNVTVGDASDPAGSMYFLYQGDSDGSTVKAFGVGDNLAAPSITRPFYFQGVTPNANYLELSTEGGTLWRSIDILGTDGPEGGATTNILGTAQAVAAAGTYLDTLVQFTPTEDSNAPELDAADKLAIWLNVDSNQQTNLMVKAGSYDNEGTPIVGGATFVLSGKTIVAGEWYRLTVKAIDDILPPNESFKIPGFQVFIDSVPMAATTSPISATFVGALREAEMITAEQQTAINSGAYLPSLVAGTPNVASTLQGVGFKGSGALDDLVWTTEDPFQGGAGGDDYKVEIGGSDVIITPQAGDLAALQAAIVAGCGTLDVTDVAAVNAALAAEIGSTGIPSWQALFLGLAPTEDGLEGFKIDSISFDADGKVVVTLPADVTPMVGRGVDIAIKLQSTSDLGGSWADVETAGGENNKTFAPVQPGLGETKKFYKVVVEFAASAN